MVASRYEITCLCSALHAIWLRRCAAFQRLVSAVSDQDFVKHEGLPLCRFVTAGHPDIRSVSYQTCILWRGSSRIQLILAGPSRRALKMKDACSVIQRSQTKSRTGVGL
jgi:hypothetical protein